MVTEQMVWAAMARLDKRAESFRCAQMVREMLEAAERVRRSEPAPLPSYQTRVHSWMQDCFGAEISADRVERNHRFIEEAVELAQSCGATASECHQLVDYVFGRPIGDRYQEVGGVMVTLAALCSAHGIHMDDAAERELARCWSKIATIREKQKGKPKHSPLPESPPSPPAGTVAVRVAVRYSCTPQFGAVWVAYGESILTDEEMMSAAGDSLVAVQTHPVGFMTAHVPIPRVAEVEGRVET